MIRTRDGFTLTLSTIKKVEDWNDAYSITKEDGWSFSINKSDCGDLVPQTGDSILMAEGTNAIPGIIIEGRVIRWKTAEQVAADHEQWRKNWRLEKLERYVEHGEELKNRVKKLHPVLQQRMERFDKESGVEFWIDSAPYEMACLEGTQALLNKVEELGLESDEAVEWVEKWWKINSAEHDPPYDYKKQMEIVPDFGEGHSGNTAGAAYAMALMILKGEGDKL